MLLAWSPFTRHIPFFYHAIVLTQWASLSVTFFSSFRLMTILLFIAGRTEHGRALRERVDKTDAAGRALDGPWMRCICIHRPPTPLTTLHSPCSQQSSLMRYYKYTINQSDKCELGFIIERQEK